MRPTPRSRRAATVLSAAALSAVLLAACGGEDTDSSAATTAAAPATTTPAAPSTAAAADGSTATTAAPATTGPAAPATTAPPATTARPTLAQVRARLQQLATFDDPVAVAVRTGDERIYVVERGGTIQLMTADGDVAAEPAADLRRLTAAGGERGLLGLAFAPAGDRAYVNYTDTDGHTNIDELAVRADGSLDADSRRRVLFIEQPYANHNGGHLRFGPDGLLYIGTGDGGSGGDPQGNGQKRTTLLGKMLRIDPAAGSDPYTVPADNPFVGDGTTRPEIWSLGLRNPWGFSFDPATGDLWVADVGQNAWEEVNVVRAADSGGAAGRGVNFGWNAFEGSHRYDDSVDLDGALLPIHEYAHGGDSLEGCSVTGGVVYRGGAVPNLSGAYLFADYCVTGIRALDAAATDDRSGDGVRVIVDDAPSIVGFGHDADGEVLVVSLGGAVYRLVAS